MHIPSGGLMFTLWRANIQIFDTQPSMQFFGQTEIQQLLVRCESFGLCKESNLLFNTIID